MSDPVPDGWLARAWTRIRGSVTPEVPRPASVMHWSQDRHHGIPFCGARMGGLWTNVPESATCEECRKLAAPMVLQWRANNR